MIEPCNLVFFLSDNHNASVAGCYGHPVVRTPHLDSIAARGARFTAAYCASPLCCPSRAAIASGRFPHQTGYWDNCMAYDGRHRSWAHRVRDEAGGTTVSVGKLHFRSTEDDNGFSREIAPMHIVDGVGHLSGLLRFSDDQPELPAQWQLYHERSGVGETEYQEYDREITRRAIDWLTTEAPHVPEPWILLVSYVSSHPPFLVPRRLWDLYPPEEMPLPVCFRPHEMPRHPALEHIRRLKVYGDTADEAAMRRVAAGYFGLVTHLDEQIGEVLGAMGRLALTDRTRVLYTSDHGESYGHHGIFGKNHLLEPAARVPLLIAGPGIEPGRVVDRLVSGVDLYPTLVAGAGLGPDAGDRDLRGMSLWDIHDGAGADRAMFAEYHASASRTGSYLWRQGRHKLVYHVDMPPQVFDLERDPWETTDLAATDEGRRVAAVLEEALRGWLDPEAVDARAKADQQAMAERHGGSDAIRDRGNFTFTPPPGSAADYGT